MSNDKALHVIFGAGPVGLAIMDELLTRGKKVRVVSRSGLKNPLAGVETMSGDAANIDFARKACEGAVIVYNALNAPYDKWAELFPPLQAGVLEGAASAKAKLVVMENVYMYGRTNGKPMTETTPVAFNTRKGKIRAKMSDDLMAAHKNGKVCIAIARSSDFIGPRVLESAMGERVIYPALAGKSASVVGNPDMPHTYNYIKDIGKALVILGEADNTTGQIWHVPSADTISTRAYIGKFSEVIGKPVKVAAAPKIVLNIMGLFMPIIREVAEMTYQFEEPFILDCTKFDQAFGKIATPIDEIVQSTLQWYKENPHQ